MDTASPPDGCIDYSLIAAAVSFYKGRAYHYVEVPWLVNATPFNITCPPGVRTFDTDAGRLVASGEQSFLDMIASKQLPKGKFLCVTPCFRDESTYDDLHQMWFMKVELIDTLTLDYMTLLNDAMDFFSQYLPCRQEVTGENSRDIVSADARSIELGSYGTRHHELVGSWSYGTGCAEPRLSHCRNLSNKPSFPQSGCVETAVTTGVKQART